MKAWTLRATIAACMLVAGASSHSALLDFKVNENVIPGSAAGSVIPAVLPIVSNFTADKLTGGYIERFQVGPGLDDFTTVAIFKGSSFFANEGVSLISPSVLNSGEALGGYQLYSIFTATGKFTSNGTINFVGSSATFELYADTNSDSGSGANEVKFDDINVNPLLVLNTDIRNAGNPTGTDYLLARSSSLIVGEGDFTPGVANGDFAIIFEGLNDLTTVDAATDGLTALGQQYFYDPNPFYDWVRISGQFDQFTLPNLGGTAEFSGSADVTFQIPEPGSLALAGLALSALGLSLRRRKV